MTLRKAPPVVRCDFPSWFKNQKHWHTLSGSTAYTFHQKWVSNLTLWKKLMAVSSCVCVVINFHCNQLHLMRWKCESSEGEESSLWISFTISFVPDVFPSSSISASKVVVHFLLYTHFYISWIFFHSLHAMRWWKKSIMMLLLLLFTSRFLPHPFPFLFLFYFLFSC